MNNKIIVVLAHMKKKEFDAMYASKTSKHPLVGSSKYNSHIEDKEKSYALALEEKEVTFTKRGHMLAQIVNLENSLVICTSDGISRMGKK